MANTIKGNGDGKNGENDTYRIPGRSSEIRREIVVREVKEGKHSNFGIYTRGGEDYVRGKPDHRKGNNVND